MKFRTCVNDEKNHGKDFNVNELEWLNIELGQRQDGNGKYFQYVKLNGNTIYKVENSLPKVFDNIKVKLGVSRSDSFDQIRHFSFTDSNHLQLAQCNQYCKL